MKLVREAIKRAITARQYAVNSAKTQLEMRDTNIAHGRSQSAKTRATNERPECLKALREKETELACVVESLREFNEEHPE
jgi:hypothetical protein